MNGRRGGRLSVGAVGAAARLSSLHWRSKHRVEATHERQEQDRPYAALAPAEAGTVEGDSGGDHGSRDRRARPDRLKAEKQDDAAAIGDALTAFISDSLLEFVTS